MGRRQRLRRSHCIGKMTYRSRAAAARAYLAYRKTVVSVSQMEIYPCRFGKHFHLGHRRKPMSMDVMAQGFMIGGVNVHRSA